MDDPKQQKYESEAPTLVADTRVSGHPWAEKNGSPPPSPATQADNSPASSEAPTLLDLGAPTLAPNGYPAGARGGATGISAPTLLSGPSSPPPTISGPESV